MRPLAEHLGAEWIVSNRLDFRDGMATGRLLDPVIRPRGAFAKLRGDRPDGRIGREQLAHELGFRKNPGALNILNEAIRPALRPSSKVAVPVVQFHLDVTASPRIRPPAFRCASRFARQERSADRRHGIHRQGVAGEPAYRPARDWPASTCWCGATARPLRRWNGSSALIRRITGIRSVWRRNTAAAFQGFSARARRSDRSGDTSQARLGPGAGGARTARAVARPRSSTAAALPISIRSLRDALAMNVDATAHLLDFLGAVRSTPRCCIFRPATRWASSERANALKETLRENYTPRRCQRSQRCLKEVESLRRAGARNGAPARSPRK